MTDAPHCPDCGGRLIESLLPELDTKYASRRITRTVDYAAGGPWFCRQCGRRWKVELPEPGPAQASIVTAGVGRPAEFDVDTADLVDWFLEGKTIPAFARI